MENPEKKGSSTESSESNENRWEYEADQRHADLIIRETGADKMSPLSHLGGDKKTIEEEEQSEELKGQEATRFRAVASRSNYLAADRPTFSTRSKKFVEEWLSQSVVTGRS